MLDTLVWLAIIYFGLRIAVNLIKASAVSERMAEIREELDEKIRVVKLEKLAAHQTILAYDEENNQFLGQASTEDELKKRLMERFPKHIFLMNEEPFTACKEYNLPEKT